jgi:hypothetical protein
MSVIGSTPMVVVFNMRGITNINSTGIGIWLKFVERLNAAKIKVSYTECSIAFSGALSFVVAPRYGGKVESTFAPFHCTKCKADVEVLIKTPDIFAIKPQLASQLCRNCQGPLQFDEVLAEYFAFLM